MYQVRQTVVRTLDHPVLMLYNTASARYVCPECRREYVSPEEVRLHSILFHGHSTTESAVLAAANAAQNAPAPLPDRPLEGKIHAIS